MLAMQDCAHSTCQGSNPIVRTFRDSCTAARFTTWKGAVIRHQDGGANVREPWCKAASGFELHLQRASKAVVIGHDDGVGLPSASLARLLPTRRWIDFFLLIYFSGVGTQKMELDS
jgi:hypothetical protein